MATVGQVTTAGLGVVLVAGMGYFAFKPDAAPRLIVTGQFEAALPNDAGTIQGTFNGVASDAVKVNDPTPPIPSRDASVIVDAQVPRDSGIWPDAAITRDATVVSNDAAVSVRDSGVYPDASSGVPPPGANPRDWVKGQIGMNIGFITDWAWGKEFADVVMHSRPWYQNSSFGSHANMDANGWPTGDGTVLMWADLPNMNGTYKGRFNANATPTVTFGGSPGRVQNLTCSAGTCTFDMVVDSAGSGLGWLTFGSTGGGVRNLKVMRPGHGFDELYNRDFLAAVGRFSPIRTMDFSGTNSNQIVRWAERTTPAHATQARHVGGVSAGASWEYIIELANLTGKDIWINVPHKADDQYITSLASLVHARLRTGLHAYVEWSNEPWNTAPGFQQGNDNHATAQQDVASGVLPRLNYDGETNTWYWAARRVARNTARVSRLFKGVFGSGFESRVCVFMNTQRGWDMWIGEGLRYLEATHQPPVRDHVCAVGGTTYVSAPGSVNSVDQLFSGIDWTTLSNQFAVDFAWSKSYGLKRVAYEGGPSFDHTGSGDQYRNAANSDPRIAGVVAEAFRRFWLAGGDAFVFYQMSGPPSNVWATYQHYPTPTHKANAVIAELGKPRPQSNIGVTIPGTVTSGAFMARNNWDQPNTCGNGEFYIYIVNSSTARAYTVSVTGSGTGPLLLSLDGDGIGSGTIGSQFRTGTIPAGSHAVRVHCTGAQNNVTGITIQ